MTVIDAEDDTSRSLRAALRAQLRKAAEGAGAPGGPRPRTRSSVVTQPTALLEADLFDLARRLAAGTYELLVLIGELDHRGSWSTFGATSCAAWLADTCEMEISTARTHVRVARAMRDHPVLDEAMSNGDVSYAKARALAPYLDADNADALVEIATRTPASRIGAAVAAWAQQHEDPDDIAARQHESRSVSWRTEPDGCVVITARLTPEAAGELCALVDAQVARADAPAGASLAQQRADALHAVVTTGSSGNARGSGGSRVTAELVVHVTADGNRLTDGTPLSDHAVAGLLPDAFVSLLLHDSQRQPIDASPRRRFPTRRQRRVLDELHPECAHPGCHATVFLQYDHIEPYNVGGPTTLDNLRRLCGPHNRQRPGASRPSTPEEEDPSDQRSGIAGVRRSDEERR